jgi:hypothetical protein
MNGSVVETGTVAAELRLGKGIAVRMDAGSRAVVYADHLVLEQGSAQVTGAYRIQALGFAAKPKQPESRGTIAVVNGNAVDVGSVTGEIAVYTAGGTLLASVGAGRALEFAGQADGTELTGLISRESGRFFITTTDGKKFRIVLNGDSKMRELLNSLVKKQATVQGTIHGNEIESSLIKPVSGGGAAGGAAGGGVSITPLSIVAAGIAVGLGTAIGLGIYNSSASR